MNIFQNSLKINVYKDLNPLRLEIYKKADLLPVKWDVFIYCAIISVILITLYYLIKKNIL